jgi:hypothetical protein
MSRVRFALAAGLGLTAVAVAIVLAQRPTAIAATNSIPASQTLAVAANKSARACQSNERIPSGIVAIRLSIGAFTGPQVTVTVLSGGRVVASGERESGWDGQNVTVPVERTSRPLFPATVCFATSQIDEEVTMYGHKTAASVAARSGRGEPLAGRLAIQYMGVGRSSWLALASSVTKQMGLGRAWSGTWIAFLVLLLMLTVGALSARLILGEVDDQATS